MKTYVVLDFETTGLDFRKEQVTEIGAIKLNEKFEEVGVFHTFVNLQVDKEISPFTDITKEQLDTGIDEQRALLALSKFIDDSVVVAQWAPFDLAFLSNYFITPESFICTKSLTSQAEPRESSSLGDTCERLGISLENAHRALDDARATVEVLKHRMITEGFDKLNTTLNTIVVTEGRPLNHIPITTQLIMTKSGDIIFDNR